MGLDMYLYKKTYIGANYPHNEAHGIIEVSTMGKPVNIQFNRVTEISEEVGYWRKANSIHKWFVDNVQDGEDNCKEYYVSLEKLQKLKGIIKRILNAPKSKKKKLAEELLPPCDGFFFGSEKIDEYYWDYLRDTLKIIEKVEEESQEDGGGWFSWVYRASW